MKVFINGCHHCQNSCGCNDPCSPPKPCIPIESKCVKYSGTFLPNSGASTGDILDDVLKKIDDKLNPSGSQTYIVSSQSINVTGNGSIGIPYIPTVKIATDGGNSIELRATGLYVAPFDSLVQFTNSYFDL